MRSVRTLLSPFTLLVAILLAACVPAAVATPAQTPAVSPAVTPSLAPAASTSTAAVPTATPANSDFVVTAAQFGQPITMKVGQTLTVVAPSQSVEWQVSFSSALLAALTPPEKMRSPGAPGWRFRAIAAGQSDIVLTSIVSPCPASSPCPPIPAKFSLSILIQP